MKNKSRSIDNTEMVDELSKWGVGLGILVVALAPLSIPMLVLTAVALLPLAVPVIALGLIGAMIAVPILLGRRLVVRLRAWSARRASGGPAAPSPTDAPSPTFSVRGSHG